MWTTASPSLASSLEIYNETLIDDPHPCPKFQEFGLSYRRVHGYTSLTVCIFGTCANILNLIVLTRKEMITPTNLILTGLAFADLLNMVEYVPFVVYLKFLPNPDNGTLRKTYPWALFVLFHSNFSQICHTIAIWLTLTLAIWRYVMVTMPVRCKTLCSMGRARWAVVMAYTIPPLLCIPIYCTFSVTSIPSSVKPTIKSNTTDSEYLANEQLLLVNSTAATSNIIHEFTQPVDPEMAQYIVNLSDLAKSYPFLKRANFWFFSIVIKLIPCLILTVVSIRLVSSLLAAKKRKERIFGRVVRQHSTHHNQHEHQVASANEESIEITSQTGSFTRSSGDTCATTRTTRMLLAVLLLFLITEFPQGILALMSDLKGSQFFTACYMSLSDLMDFTALLNSGINFILYCTMSRKFRDVFCHVFRLNKVLRTRCGIA